MFTLDAQTDAVELAGRLIRCPSITPEDHGALDLVEGALKSLGFSCERKVFADEGLPAVDNLYARLGTGHPHFCYAGHTDVVPPGNPTQWDNPPFDGVVHEGELWGRGASDMKGSIAAFLTALARFVSENKFGSISLLITGDEEGMAINGTRKMVAWLKERGEKVDHCLVGEPTNPHQMGDMIKVGRRGSFNAQLHVHGVQGHVAYPHRADNPVPKLMTLLQALTKEPLDDGYERFQPSNLVVTSVTTPPLAENVIPGEAHARFNVRFNPNWSGETLEKEIRQRLADTGLTEDDYTLTARISGEAFLTTDAYFTDLLQGIVEEHTGRKPELSTSGGTSDARFIKDLCPVAEFGLVGATMHKVNERVATEDIALLSKIYERILIRYFS